MDNNNDRTDFFSSSSFFHEDLQISLSLYIYIFHLIFFLKTRNKDNFVRCNRPRKEEEAKEAEDFTNLLRYVPVSGET